MADDLKAFVRESNRIEGIVREPTQVELDAHAAFLSLQTVCASDLEAFVAEVAARPLRRSLGMNVSVGGHRPPPGGPGIEDALTEIVLAVNCGEQTPYVAHIEYEKLHPFLDGNGRSGRALWAWHMRREGRDPFELPFLQRWYYDSLEAADD